MTTEILTLAEKEAEKAESLLAFSGLKLAHIKRQIAQLLGMIGKAGMFDEYTRHDISHVNAMLMSLDWIVPDTTKKIMSPADWLITVLAIYFHDLGMLVTEREYAERNDSGFPAFKQQVLFGGNDGADYQSKVAALGPDASERFFYQEFVRHKHAERIRAWILGQEKALLGITPKAIAEVTKLLEPLGTQFRRDLGIVCESHHLNDLTDEKKYKASQPYGNSDAETANIQYSAVLLRTADLLHVTSDRTPSIAFRTINPIDPLSQQEWAKQLAVTRVRPKIGVNKDGVPDENAPKDTIEVHAYFTSEDGFFGLTSYLVYAAEQLKKSHEWITGTSKTKGVFHEFPWKKIDDSNIETEGFIRDTFTFSIDQAKVLDLLTGHTLYNDTKVVLRELAQNSLDAIRLQFYPQRASERGKIAITWDSKNRLLEVRDNGTGMSQRIINDFLLKVGSSRYQDPEFKKKHPNFSSISRFGIGVLSAFMIADVVDILTCHPDDEQARQITLRSVHGKYLVRLIAKHDPIVKPLGAHGTSFKLRVRQKVELNDVLELAKHWLVIPDCEVTVVTDGSLPTKVGSESVRAALISLLQVHGIAVDPEVTLSEPVTHSSDKLVRVIEKTLDGVSISFAVEWNTYFKAWAFMKGPGTRAEDVRSDLAKAYSKLATCVEGIRVESGAPGIKESGIFALANVTGPNAPKTNVARSGLEATEQREQMLEQVYTIYGEHATNELKAMHERRGFSLTWATQEANYLFNSLPTGATQLTSKPVFDNVRNNLALHLFERNDRREVCSAANLWLQSSIWTIDCSFLRSAEFLIREVKSDSSVSQLAKALGIEGFGSPGDTVLCRSGWRDNNADGDILVKREVASINIHPEQRRVDLEWVARSTSPKWHYGEIWGIPKWAAGGVGNIYIAAAKITIKAPLDYGAIKSFGDLFILPGSPITEALVNSYKTALKKDKMQDAWAEVVTIAVLIRALSRRVPIKDESEFVLRSIADLETAVSAIRGGQRLGDSVDVGLLSDLIREKRPLFDSSAWQRTLQQAF